MTFQDEDSVEIKDEDILYYLEDEEGTEVGFVILEDGEEVECYYEGFEDCNFQILEEDNPQPESKDAKEGEIIGGITRDDVAGVTADINSVAADGIAVAKELKEAYDDILGTFSFLKK